MDKFVIFDLDGTLALIDHRLHFIKNGNRDWDSFHAACVDDIVNDPLRLINRSLYNESVGIIILTGRVESVREQTIEWLNKNHIMYDKLVMRKDGDRRPDYEIKKEFIDSFGKDKIICVFEDRDRVVEMWRKEGLVCLQVSNGKY